MFRTWREGKVEPYIGLRVEDEAMSPILPPGSIVVVNTNRTDPQEIVERESHVPGIHDFSPRLVAVNLERGGISFRWLKTFSGPSEHSERQFLVQAENPSSEDAGPPTAWAKSSPIVGVVEWSFNAWDW